MEVWIKQPKKVIFQNVQLEGDCNLKKWMEDEREVRWGLLSYMIIYVIYYMHEVTNNVPFILGKYLKTAVNMNHKNQLQA